MLRATVYHAGSTKRVMNAPNAPGIKPANNLTSRVPEERDKNMTNKASPFRFLDGKGSKNEGGFNGSFLRCPVAAAQARSESGSEWQMPPFTSKPSKKKRPAFAGRRAGNAIASGVNA
jgi:hypothetical protein